MKIHVLIVLALCALLTPPAQAQAEPEAARSDSLPEQMEAVATAGFNTIHAALVDTLHSTARFNQQWMALAHARNLKVQLYSWKQPNGWRGASAFYWARTFEAEDRNLFSHDTGISTRQWEGIR